MLPLGMLNSQMHRQMAPAGRGQLQPLEQHSKLWLLCSHSLKGRPGWFARCTCRTHSEELLGRTLLRVIGSLDVQCFSCQPESDDASMARRSFLSFERLPYQGLGRAR